MNYTDALCKNCRKAIRWLSGTPRLCTSCAVEQGWDVRLAKDSERGRAQIARSASRGNLLTSPHTKNPVSQETAALSEYLKGGNG